MCSHPSGETWAKLERDKYERELKKAEQAKKEGELRDHGKHVLGLT